MIDLQMTRQRSYGDIERAGNEYLSQSGLARRFDELVGAGKNRRAEHIFEQLFREKTETVFGFTLVLLEEKFLKDAATVKIGDKEGRNRTANPRRFQDAAQDSLLVLCLKQ